MSIHEVMLLCILALCVYTCAADCVWRGGVGGVVFLACSENGEMSHTNLEFLLVKNSRFGTQLGIPTGNKTATLKIPIPSFIFLLIICTVPVVI